MDSTSREPEEKEETHFDANSLPEDLRSIVESLRGPGGRAEDSGWRPPAPSSVPEDLLSFARRHYASDCRVRRLLALYFLRYDDALLEHGLISSDAGPDSLIGLLYEKECLIETISLASMRHQIALSQDCLGLDDEVKEHLRANQAKYDELVARWQTAGDQTPSCSWADYEEQLRDEVQEQLDRLAAAEEGWQVDPEEEDYWDYVPGEADSVQWNFLDGVFDIPTEGLAGVVARPVSCRRRKFLVILSSGDEISVGIFGVKGQAAAFCDRMRAALGRRFADAIRETKTDGLVEPDFGRLFPWRHYREFLLHIRNTPLGKMNLEPLSVGELMVLDWLVDEKLREGADLAASKPFRAAYLSGFYREKVGSEVWNRHLYTSDTRIAVKLRLASGSSDGNKSLALVKKIIASFRPHNSAAPALDMIAQGQKYLQTGGAAAAHLAYAAAESARQYDMDPETEDIRRELSRKSLQLWLDRAERQGDKQRLMILRACRFKEDVPYEAEEPMMAFVRRAWADKNAEIRLAAYGALGRTMGEYPVPVDRDVLLRGLQDPAWRVRCKVVDLLAEEWPALDESDAVDSTVMHERVVLTKLLVDVVCADPCAAVRLEGIEGLVLYGAVPELAQEALTHATGDSDDVVRRIAESGLKCLDYAEIRRKLESGELDRFPPELLQEWPCASFRELIRDVRKR